MNDAIDITAAQRKTLLSLLKTYLPGTEVWVYGSRANWTSRPGSDLDMVVFTSPEQSRQVADLKETFEESTLPFRVDLFVWDEIPDSFKANIRKQHVVLQASAEKTQPPLRAGWTRVTLGEIAQLKNGKGLKNSLYCDDGTYPVWGANGAIARTNELLNDDSVVVIGRVGAYCGSVHAAFGPNWVTDNAIIATPQVDNDFRFLYYLLKSLNLERAATGSAQPLVTQSGLKVLSCLRPPLPEQKTIAHILGTLDDKIELNRRMNETLEGIASTIFKSWFVDFDPVRAKAEGRDTGLPEEIEDLFPDGFQDSELGKIPKGWTVGALGDIAANPRRGVKPNEVSSTTPYIGLEHMPRRSIALDSWGIAEQVGSQKSRFDAGDILFGKLRPYFHKVGIAPVSGVCSTDILVTTPKDESWQSYILEVASSKAFVDYTDAHSAGTKMPRTNWNDMGRYPLALPPGTLAKEFHVTVAPLLEKISMSIHQNRHLTGLRDAMLPHLLSGNIALPDVNVITKEVS